MQALLGRLKGWRLQPGRLRKFMRAAKSGKEEMLKKLLEKGVDVNSRDNTGHTALMSAAGRGHYVCVDLLLRKGADKDAKDRKGNTAHDIAVENNHKEIAELLHSQELVPEALKTKVEEAITAAEQAKMGSFQKLKLTVHARKLQDLRTRALAQSADELAKAAGMNDLQAMERLIAEGASPDAKDEQGVQALVLAAGRGHEDALKLLHRHGANLNATDPKGGTALMEAAWYGKADCAEFLLDKGAEKDAADERGDTALHYAAMNGQLECARLLVRARADQAKKNNNGNTALEVARQRGHAEIAALLEHPDEAAKLAEEKAGQEDQELTTAAASNDLQTMERLIAKGVSADAKGKDRFGNDGMPALVLAAVRGHEDALKLLLKHGANLNATAPSGHTALELAIYNGKAEIAALLEQADADAKTASARDLFGDKEPDPEGPPLFERVDDDKEPDLYPD